MLTLVISSTLQVHFHAPVNKYTHLAMREMLQKDNANVWETERERLSISWYRWPGSVSPCLWLNTLIPAKQNRLQLGAKHRLSREIPLNTPPAQCSAESMASCSFCSACCDADAFGCLWKAAKCLICGRRAMWELIFRSFSELWFQTCPKSSVCLVKCECCFQMWDQTVVLLTAAQSTSGVETNQARVTWLVQLVTLHPVSGFVTV